ncbi:hypothetical protein DEO72_LG9g872 [Vigna unguiculata]|uniref:Uncharacterized protein n=1 Tax=Vigna unguiculata TaxID=3917 RepID=A0A4D6MYU8_VIGUN|nr:hypothetical protein DEO72_LG9g872 [Vigna unguiculata]
MAGQNPRRQRRPPRVDHQEGVTGIRIAFLLHSPSRAWQGSFLSEDVIDTTSVTITARLEWRMSLRLK